MKNIILICASLISFYASASASASVDITGIYTGTTKKGQSCVVEISDFVANGNTILVRFKTSLGSVQDFYYVGSGQINDYAPGVVFAHYEDDEIEEMMKLRLKLDESGKEVVGVTTLEFTSWTSEKADDVCTYLEKQ